ncbi:MAG: hypothetical protein J6K45_04960 [Clostridia bacterium]|nr:hypothetical protein [Clostridia bacterium]
MPEKEKIVSIDVLRINHKRKKICECERPLYEVDCKNRLVYCEICGAIVDAFDAIYKVAMHVEEINEDIKRAIENKKILETYKPHLKEARRYERMMRAKDMLPKCPKCNKAFNWNEVTMMINKHYYKEE